MIVSHAMVLAAGKGTRMRALSQTVPKPLVKVAGTCLLDRILTHLKAAGIQKNVVNMHHLADQIEAHLQDLVTEGTVVLSDERSALLETGGGVKKALPYLGTDPFCVINGDALWVDSGRSNLVRLQEAFQPSIMDILLLLAPRGEALGYEGLGDFKRQVGAAAGTTSFPLSFRGEDDAAPYVFAGVQIIKPALYADTPSGAWSNVELFKKTALAGRLYGLMIEGSWMHVGTPEAITEAEEKLLALGVA